MQISPLSTQAQSGLNSQTTSVQKKESFFTSLSKVNVEFSADGDSVTITGSKSSLFIDTLYTAQGINSTTPSISSLQDTGASSSESSGTFLSSMQARIDTLLEEADSLGSQFAQSLSEGSGLFAPEDTSAADDKAQYLQILKQRVEYLFAEAAKQSGIMTEMPSIDLGQYQETGEAAAGETTEAAESEDTVSVTVDTSYFSAENTASRIVNFALSFYTGGDKAEFVAEIRDAITQGFEEAKAAFGGFLPDVSYKTLDLVNQALDAFAAGEYSVTA